MAGDWTLLVVTVGGDIGGRLKTRFWMMSNGFLSRHLISKLLNTIVKSASWLPGSQSLPLMVLSSYTSSQMPTKKEWRLNRLRLSYHFSMWIAQLATIVVLSTLAIWVIQNIFSQEQGRERANWPRKREVADVTRTWQQWSEHNRLGGSSR